MPGGGKGRGGGAAGGGGGSGGGTFEDYDEEEVAALEAYMKTHPTKEEDKEAIRKRAKELSASIGSGKVKDNVRYLISSHLISSLSRAFKRSTSHLSAGRPTFVVTNRMIPGTSV